MSGPLRNPSRRRCVLSSAALAIVCAWPVASAWAQALPVEIKQTMPQSRLQGQGRLTFLGLSIYDARLWTLNDFDAARYTEQPVALELIYLRKLYGKKIAERSIKEMQGIGSFTAEQSKLWVEQMTALFPDVKERDRITGVYVPQPGAVHFYINGQLKGKIEDAQFAQLFVGIWLSPRTSEPALRERLLGKTNP
jgi:hypothetical protein